MLDLTLPGGSHSHGYGINASGQVVGQSQTSFGEHAFFHDAGQIVADGYNPITFQGSTLLLTPVASPVPLPAGWGLLLGGPGLLGGVARLGARAG